MKKIRLIEDESYNLLAVYTANSESQMACLLNYSLNIDLQREPETRLHNSKGVPSISLYSDRRTFKFVYFVLVTNMFELKAKFTDCRQINYFVKISGATPAEIKHYMDKIDEIDGVIFCSEMEYSPKIKKYFDLL